MNNDGWFDEDLKFALATTATVLLALWFVVTIAIWVGSDDMTLFGILGRQFDFIASLFVGIWDVLSGLPGRIC